MPLLLTSSQRWNPFRIAFVAWIADWLSSGLAEALGETYPKLAILDMSSIVGKQSWNSFRTLTLSQTTSGRRLGMVSFLGETVPRPGND